MLWLQLHSYGVLREFVDVVEIDEVGVALHVLIVVNDLREETTVLDLGVVERHRLVEVFAFVLVCVVF